MTLSMASAIILFVSVNYQEYDKTMFTQESENE